MPAKEQELPSSREAEPPQYQNREPTSQTTISSGSRSASSTKDSIAKLSSEDEVCVLIIIILQMVCYSIFLFLRPK